MNLERKQVCGLEQLSQSCELTCTFLELSSPSLQCLNIDTLQQMVLNLPKMVILSL